MRAITSAGVSVNERGALLIVVLFILLVTTLLGLSAMDATGLEMQMSSNSREQLMMGEAAEYAVAQVVNKIRELDGFGDNSLANQDCGLICFNDTCTNGYCFFGIAGDSLSWKTCAPGLPLTNPAREAAVWSDASGRYGEVAVPDLDVSAKYIIEFRCYAAIDDSVAMDDTNHTKIFRITTLVRSKSGRAGVMLRVALKDL